MGPNRELKLGLIGMPLGHSWSPQIHDFLMDGQNYDLIPLQESQLDSFFEKRDFDMVNVTIPYKQTVLRYLDEIDPAAEKIGAVNCIVNKDGKLIGTNTDVIGFKDMLVANGIEVQGKHVAVFGDGGVSKAVHQALLELSARVDVVGRKGRVNTISYERAQKKSDTYGILVNCTSVGMSPNDNASIVDVHQYPNAETVLDVVANPLRTRFLQTAQLAGRKTLGGLEMLVRQAAAAESYAFGITSSEEKIQACIRMLKKELQSIVLIGMPTCGKSTIARLLSKRLGYDLVEMDEELVKEFGCDIPTVFRTLGEEEFRKRETELCRRLKEKGHTVISTGGGVIKNEENMIALKENGVVFFIDRDLKYLYSSDGRPLSSSLDAVKKLYEERLPFYQKYSDVCIKNNESLNETIEEILMNWEG